MIPAFALLALLALGADGGRLEGTLSLGGGETAEGFSVHLIDARGLEVGDARVAPDGRYVFEGVPAGSYALGVGNRSGQRAPVAAPPVTIRAGAVARRDLAVVPTDDETRRRRLALDPSLGSWWSRLTAPAKAWVVLVSIVAGWFLYDALDEDEQEVAASPM